MCFAFLGPALLSMKRSLRLRLEVSEATERGGLRRSVGRFEECRAVFPENIIIVIISVMIIMSILLRLLLIHTLLRLQTLFALLRFL